MTFSKNFLSLPPNAICTAFWKRNTLKRPIKGQPGHRSVTRPE